MKEGSEWTTKMSIAEFNVVEKDENWKVNYVDKSKNQMELNGLVRDLRMDKNEANVNMNVGGDLNNYFTVDTKSGWPLNVEAKSTMSGEAKMTDPQQMTWPVNMNIISKIQFEFL